MGTSFVERMEVHRLLALGYLSYMALGFGLLSLPISQAQAVSALDNLFIAVSAVSTTGLVTVDPGSSYSFFGELVILLLIQAGGIGYMTFSSAILVALGREVSGLRENLGRAEFSVPHRFAIGGFLRQVASFSFACEAIGALWLYFVFRAAGESNALWLAIFHSVSAFCTAGFSLLPDSLEGYRDHVGLNLVVSALALLGAVGFLVWVDFWQNLRGQRSFLTFTSKIILRATFVVLLVGAALIFLLEPGLQELPPWQRLNAALFQTMTATTTVGFNTVPIGGLSMAVVALMLVLMAVGASPAGTGGGVKSTTAAIAYALVRSTLKQEEEVTLFGHPIGEDRIRLATTAILFFLAVASTASVLLLAIEGGAMAPVVFEVASALGTVGLSTGLTSSLEPLSKLLVIFLMYVGRLGILTFGIAIARHRESIAEQDDCDVVV
jgi:trk system potassium uptake protein TrkH